MAYDILVVDGHGLAHRAGNVMHLRNEKGESTSVAFGVLNMLRSLLENHQVKEACVCWDWKGYKLKELVYPEYKKNRRSGGEGYELHLEIGKQIEELFKILPAFGIKQLRKEGVEADDVVGLLCEELKQRDKKALVVSSDHDFFQLVSPGVTVYHPQKNIYLNLENFEQNVGIRLELYLFYRTLIGDLGDNIKGPKGFGSVTAKKLLNKHGPWTEWFVNGHPKGEILQDLNVSQKKIFLEKGEDGNSIALTLLVKNYSLMSVGFLDIDSMGDIVVDFYGQKPVFDEEAIKGFFLEKQFNSYLASLRRWTHPFRMLSIHGGKIDAED